MSLLDKLYMEIVNEIQPYDRARLLIELDQAQRKRLIGYFSDQDLSEIIQELDYDHQQLMVEEIGLARASRILLEMSADDAADLLGEIDEDLSRQLLQLISNEEAAEIKSLLGYPENTAGGIMTIEYIVVEKEFTAAETIEMLRKAAPDAETVYYLYVVEKDKCLIGVLSLRDLIVADPEIKIADIMSEKVVSVPIDMDQEEAARVLELYDFLAVPVVDHSGRLVGIITVDDAMDVLTEEATEDITKFGGIGGKETGVPDLRVGILEAAGKRIPWLLFLLGIGLLSGSIIAQFEATLQAVVVLAIFIPMIAGMAGNTGTQSLAVVVRGLAIKEYSGRDVLQLIKREAGVGLLIGTVNGAAISILAAVWQRNLWLGFVVGLSLWITMFFATLAGTVIPLVMVKLRVDPAVASGPFITTLNDILGLTIYFTVATIFMRNLI